jgi:hypothetical protein
MYDSATMERYGADQRPASFLCIVAIAALFDAWP